MATKKEPHLSKVPFATWGLEKGRVVFSRPGHRRTLSVEEAVELADNGDRDAAKDLLDAWHSIKSGSPPVEMPPELDDFVVRVVGWLAAGQDADTALGLKQSGRPRRGRKEWVEERRLEAEVEAEVQRMLVEGDSDFNLSPSELEQTAVQLLADEKGTSGRALQAKFKRARKSRSTRNLGFSVFDDQGDFIGRSLF